MDHDRLQFALELTALLAVVVAIMAMCGTLVLYTAFRKVESDPARMLTQLAQHSHLLQLLTVLVIVISALILRIIDAISADAIISLLSGIGGYVLGGLTRSPGGMHRNEAARSN